MKNIVRPEVFTHNHCLFHAIMKLNALKKQAKGIGMILMIAKTMVIMIEQKVLYIAKISVEKTKMKMKMLMTNYCRRELTYAILL